MKNNTKKLMLRVLSLSTALMIFCIVFTGMPTGTNQDLFGFGLNVSAASSVDLTYDNMPLAVAGLDHVGTITGGTGGKITITPPEHFSYSGSNVTLRVIGQGVNGGTGGPGIVFPSTAQVVNGSIVITLNDTVTAVDSIAGIDSLTGVTENSDYALKLNNNASNIDATLYSDASMSTESKIDITAGGSFKSYAIGATVYVKIAPYQGYTITSTLRGEIDSSGIEYDFFNYDSIAVKLTKQDDGSYTGSFTTAAGDANSAGAFISNVWEAVPITYTLTGPTLTDATGKFTLNNGTAPVTKANDEDVVKYTITPVTGYGLAPLTADSFTVTGGTIDGYANGVLTITDVTANLTVGLANGVTSVVAIEEYDGTALPITGTILITDSNITADQNITWTSKSATEPDDTVPYGDIVTIPLLADGYTITGTPGVMVNGGDLIEGTYAEGKITFTMPDIGNTGTQIDSIQVEGLSTSLKGYDIAYNKSAMKIYSEVAAPTGGTVDLSGKTADTDGTLAMKGNTGYYAEIIPPAGATSYDVTPKLFGMNDPDGNWGFIVTQPDITVIKDSNGKTIGLYFAASPADMEIAFKNEAMNIRFSNVVIPTPPASSEKEITSFKIGSNTGTISGTNISVTVPFGTDVKSLTPTIGLSAGATVSPLSGVAQDFTSPVNYTVKAQDKSTKTYKVTVTIASQTAPTFGIPTSSPTAAPTTEPKIGGTCGWTNIEEKILSANAGETLNIDMNGTTNVPQSILSDIKGKDVTVVFDMGTYSWAINGKDITSAQSVDLGVTYTPNVISPDLVDGVAGNSTFIQFQLNYSGSFGFTGKLTIHLPVEKAGQYANLYYFNLETKKLEIVATALIQPDGTATFNFSHASDYVVVMEKTPKSGNLAAGASITDNAKPITENGMPYMVIATVLAVGMIAFKQKKAKK